ncbi:hypothetical protein CMV_016054 [Castanea mollissima]|uniref:Uncharacterized protein n=1 Tax=Castanea mollissima TaxID=60419 RepID=A0A8J4QUC3_9ROSI|nr:hypothetical protein CMV_016054 [Castanea mollissima]
MPFTPKPSPPIHPSLPILFTVPLQTKPRPPSPKHSKSCCFLLTTISLISLFVFLWLRNQMIGRSVNYANMPHKI